MKGVHRGNGSNVGHFDADTRRSGASGNRVRVDAAANDPKLRGAQDPRAVRPGIAELRRQAELERAFEPPATRRFIIDFAIGTGWSIADVERLTYSDIAYIARTLTQGARHGARR